MGLRADDVEKPRTHSKPRGWVTLAETAAASTGKTGRSSNDESRHTEKSGCGGGDRSGSRGDKRRTAPRETSARAEGYRNVNNMPT